MQADNTYLAQRIRVAMAAADMDVDQVMDLTGVWTIESCLHMDDCADLSAESLRAIARVTGASVEWLTHNAPVDVTTVGGSDAT
jgi:hypothetical protein